MLRGRTKTLLMRRLYYTTKCTVVYSLVPLSFAARTAIELQLALHFGLARASTSWETARSVSIKNRVLLGSGRDDSDVEAGEGREGDDDV